MTLWLVTRNQDRGRADREDDRPTRRTNLDVSPCLTVTAAGIGGVGQNYWIELDEEEE